MSLHLSRGMVSTARSCYEIGFFRYMIHDATNIVHDCVTLVLHAGVVRHGTPHRTGASFNVR